MISCKLCGGLGNQLFQIYNVISLAIANNRSFYFNNITNDTRMLYFDTIFSKIKNITINPTTIQLKKYKILKENGFHFTPFTNLEDNIVIDNSYVQSEKYFVKNYYKINKIIGIDDKIDEINKKYYSQF
mgnify:CR=1 FL=1